MTPIESGPSAMEQVWIGAAGNLIGGFLALVLWQIAVYWNGRKRHADLVNQKRASIAIELGKLRTYLRLLIENTDYISSTIPNRSSTVLAAIVRLGPDLTPGRSIEPQLGEMEIAISRVEIIASRLFLATTGIAMAMNGVAAEITKLQDSLKAEAENSLSKIADFEQAIIK
jgi:hypothetical protein